MRALIACLVLAACATTPRAPAERLAGCWINRTAQSTMRWTPDQAHPGVMNGSLSVGGGAATPYLLTPDAEGNRFCELEADAQSSRRCWSVASGESGSLEGGRVFVDSVGDNLRIEIIGDGPRRVIFQGRRDGCD